MSAIVIEEREVLEQLAWCVNEMLSAIATEDSIAFHYTFQGTEFELMRAFWLLGDEERARRIHKSIGDHSPENCPVCAAPPPESEEGGER